MSNEKKFRRSRTDRKLAGVCAGIANFLGLDATLIRVVYALATLFTAFAGLIIYIILWLIVPEE